MRKLEFVSGSLDDAGGRSLRGHVDEASPGVGIAGWLIDVAAPGRRHQLELLAGSVVVATCETILFRDDIAGFGDSEATPGFRFPMTSILRVLELPQDRQSTSLMVRVVATDLWLRSSQPILLSDCRDWAEQFARSRPEAMEIDPDDFMLALVQRRDLAYALLRMRPAHGAGSEAGRLEIVCPMPDDVVVLIGWLRESMPIDMAALIVSGRKFTAGVRGLTYQRPDLPSPAVGFVALAKTAWRPRVDVSFRLVWDRDGARYLQSNSDWRTMSIDQIKSWLTGLAGKVNGNDFTSIRRLVDGLPNWMPSGNRQPALHCGFDRVLVLHGFGAFVQGWVLSPLKGLVSLTLRIGNQVLVSDGNAFSMMPRPDLATAFQSYGDVANTSGFRAVFRGSVKTLESAMLKLHFEDGSFHTVALDMALIRVLNHSGNLPMLSRLCPALPNETFFDAFHRAYQSGIRSSCGQIKLSSHLAQAASLVIVLPEAEDVIYLLMDALTTNAHHLPRDVGIVLICDAKHPRSKLLGWTQSLGGQLGRSICLVEVPDIPYALWSLSAVVDALHIQAFWYVGSTVLPTELGWATAGRRFAEHRSDLELFVDGSHASTDFDEPTGLSFIWGADQFKPWIAEMPIFLSGHFRDSLLPYAAPDGVTQGAVIVHTRTSVAATIARSDARIYDAHVNQPAR